jgi:hypothetical protein
MSVHRELETAEQGANRGASVFRSCAEQTGLPLEVVVRAAQTGQLGRLIAKRSGHIAERRNLRGHLARCDQLLRRAELMSKQVPDW